MTIPDKIKVSGINYKSVFEQIYKQLKIKNKAVRLIQATQDTLQYYNNLLKED